MIELLAALSASASAGMRIALPLLVIGLLHGENLWYRVPLLSAIHPQIVLGVLVSWSLFELFASKRLLGQRVLQTFQPLFSPLVGAMMGIAIASTANFPIVLVTVIGIVGGLLALVIQLVTVGWFFRLRGIPLWAVLLQDTLCVFLVLFAFEAPEEGGIIALLLLWLAIRSSKEWYRWYVKRNQARLAQREAAPNSPPQQPD